jgi:glyoxylase-like metal-dependent hydrolase (beta-lactamase superfamily II)
MSEPIPWAEESFPPDGLVAAAREVYRHAPLAGVEIRPGVFTFSGAGGTVTALAALDGTVVIDTGYGPRVPEIRQAIAAAIGRPPTWLVDSHWHFDHTDGNAAFAAAGATIIAHANCRARLSRPQHVRSLDWRIPAASRDAWPTVALDGPMAIELGSEEVRLLPQAPAHTDGDIAIRLERANVLVMGDLMTEGGYPVIDESSGGSLRGMIEAVGRLLPQADAGTVVVPGHGLVGDRGALHRFHDMLRAIEDRILPLWTAGLPSDRIVDAAPSAAFDDAWGRGYVTGALFTRMVLAGLGGGEKTEDRPG